MSGFPKKEKQADQVSRELKEKLNFVMKEHFELLKEFEKLRDSNHIAVPDELLEEFNNFCKRNAVPRDEVVKKSLSEYIQKNS